MLHLETQDETSQHCSALIYWECHSVKIYSNYSNFKQIPSGCFFSELAKHVHGYPWHSVAVSRTFLAQLRFKMHVFPFSWSWMAASQQVHNGSHDFIEFGLTTWAQDLSSAFLSWASLNDTCLNWLSHANQIYIVNPILRFGRQQWGSNEISNGP